MPVTIQGNEISLVGVVGADWFWDDGFNASDVSQALATVGSNTDIVVRINSGGGIATEGAAIHAALVAHKGKVTTIVDGIAASAASLIFMAGSHRIMSAGAVVMIHDCAGMTFGDYEAHRKTMTALDVLSNAYASIYAERTGRSVDEARMLMREETWMNAEQALEMKFADEAASAINDNEPDFPPFAYQAYARAPGKLVALATTNGWKPRVHIAAQAVVTPPPQKEQTAMTEKETAGTAPPPEDNPSTEDAMTAQLAVAAEVTQLFNDAGLGFLATSFVKERKTADEAKARIEEAGKITAAVDTARKINPEISADIGKTMLAEGKTLEQAIAHLWEQVVAKQSDEVSSDVTNNETPAGKAAADKAVANYNRRVKK